MLWTHAKQPHVKAASVHPEISHEAYHILFTHLEVKVSHSQIQPQWRSEDLQLNGSTVIPGRTSSENVRES